MPSTNSTHSPSSWPLKKHQQNVAKETSAPNATTSDTTEKTAPSTDACTATSCDPDMMKTDVSTTPNTPAQIPLNKNLHHHPLSESPHQKLLKSHTSPLTDKAVTPPHHQMESEKEGERERNPSGRNSKKTLTEVYPDNSGKWMKNMTKNSGIFPSLLIIRSSMMTPPTTTLMANQATPKIFEFSMEFQM